MAKTVVIGCKLPHGLTFKGSESQDITLNGMNTALVTGGHGITHVDESEANRFFKVYEDFAPVTSLAIFYNGSAKVSDLAAMGHELRGEKTGFEGLDPAKPAVGLKPEEKQALDDSKIATKPPVRAAASKADKDAARELAALQSAT